MIFEKPTRINLIGIPGTSFVALTDDMNLTPQAIKQASIILEIAIAELPAVMALRPGSVVWDVGAFIGDTALIFLARGCKVVAFEPQADAFFAAQWNLRDHDAIVILAAVGDGGGVVKNSDSIAGNLGTRTVSRAAAGPASLALDNFAFRAHQTPDFIKIDVEGFEPAVIAGAAKLLAAHHPTLLIEIYPEMLARNGWTAADVTAPLLALGYSITEVIGNSSEPRWDVLCTYEN